MTSKRSEQIELNRWKCCTSIQIVVCSCAKMTTFVVVVYLRLIQLDQISPVVKYYNFIFFLLPIFHLHFVPPSTSAASLSTLFYPRSTVPFNLILFYQNLWKVVTKGLYDLCIHIPEASRRIFLLLRTRTSEERTLALPVCWIFAFFHLLVVSTLQFTRSPLRSSWPCSDTVIRHLKSFDFCYKLAFEIALISLGLADPWNPL